VRKSAFWLLCACAVLLAGMAIFIGLAPWLMNQPAVKTRIEAAASRMVGGQLEYERVRLSLLPRPTAAVTGIRLTIPGIASVSISRLDLSATLPPLLRGAVRLSKVGLDHPTVELTASTRTGSTGQPPSTGPTPGQTVGSILGAIASRMPDGVIAVHQGRVAAAGRGTPQWALDHLDAQITVNPPPAETERRALSALPDFRFVGALQGDLMKKDSLPDTVHFAIKRCDLLPRTVSCSGAEVRLLDASFTVGTVLIDDYLTAGRSMDLSLGGTVGPDAIRWLDTLSSLPPEVTIHAPVLFSSTRVRWNFDGAFQLEGSASVQKGLTLAFELTRTPEQMTLKALRIRDAESNATISFSLGHDSADLSFSGRLTQASLNTLFEHERFQFGWVQGGLTAHVVPDRPLESTASGRLEGERLLLPVSPNTPVTINRIILRADGRTVTLNPLTLTWGGHTHTVKAIATAAPDRWQLDLKSDGMEWEPLQALFAHNGGTPPGNRPPAPRPYPPVRATVRIDTRYLTADGWRARRVRAVLSLQSDGSRATLTGGVQGVLVGHKGLPGPVEFNVKRFEVHPPTILISEANARLLDASVVASGTVSQDRTAPHAAALTARATIGPTAMAWLRSLTSLPPEWALRTPVTLSQTRLLWDRNGTVSLEGTAAVKEGPTLAFEAVRTPDRLDVKSLRVRDAESHATLAFSLAHNRMDLRFSGRLTQTSLNTLFAHERLHLRWVRGEFTAHIVLDHPMESTVKGRLDGERLIPPVAFERPVIINRFVVSAANRTLTFNPLVIALDATVHTVTGHVTASPDGWQLTVHSDGLEWEPLRALLASQSTHDHPATHDRPLSAVEAAIHVSTDYFSAGGWTAAPARADIIVKEGITRITVKEAVICGVNVTGRVTIAPDRVGLDFHPEARRQDLRASMACLSGDEKRMTGAFDLAGRLDAAGAGQSLLDKLQGQFAFTATEGRLYQNSLTVRILSYLNLTELLRGSFPDPGEEGVPYASIVLRGIVRHGLVTLNEAVLISPTIDLAGKGSITLADRTMDVIVLATPFTTVASLVKKIPLLGTILGDSVVSIPIRVSGPIDNPKFTSIPPSAVSDEVIGLMSRTLSLPFTVMEPLMPKKLIP